MKKNKCLFIALISLIVLMFGICPVYAATVTNNPTAICLKSDIVLIARIIGHVLLIVKIGVPIILIGLGTFDLGKAVLSSDDNAIKASTSILIKRVIAGVVIFFIPAILTFVMTLIDNVDQLNSFNCITDCIENPNTCIIPENNGVLNNNVDGEGDEGAEVE